MADKPNLDGGDRETGGASARRAGRPPAIQGEDLETLLAVVHDLPQSTLPELNREFERRSGIKVSTVTIRSTLKRAGYKRVVPTRSRRRDVERVDAPVMTTPDEPVIYGYRDMHRVEPTTTRYPSCLTDAEWALLAPIFDNATTGRPPKYPRRAVLNAIFYVLRSGGSWRMIPRDFPPWQTVYGTFSRWSEEGKMEQAFDKLRDMWRRRAGRNAAPTAAIIDSQSVKTSPQGGSKGYDAGKKVKGRKRHIVTDTLGLLLVVCIQTADVQDRDGAHAVVAKLMKKVPTIELIWADSGYAGQAATAISAKHGINVQVVRRADDATVGRWTSKQLPLPAIPSSKFKVLPKRWLVERAFSWIDRPRRMAKDYDRSPERAVAWTWLTNIRLLVRRLAAAEAGKTI